MSDRITLYWIQVLRLLQQGPLSAENLATTLQMETGVMEAGLIGLDINGYVFQSRVTRNWFISQLGLRQLEAYHS